MKDLNAFFSADGYEGESRRGILQARDLLERGRNLERRGETARALSGYADALCLVEGAGEKRAAGYINFLSGVAHYRIGHFNSTISFFQRAFSLWRENDASEYLTRIRSYLICLHARRFEYARSLKLARYNFHHLENSREEQESGRTHLGIALILRHGEPAGPNSRRLLARVGGLTGLPPRAADYFEESLRRARRDDCPETLLPALREYAIFLRCRGTPQEQRFASRHLLEEGLALAERLGRRAESDNLHTMLGREFS